MVGFADGSRTKGAAQSAKHLRFTVFNVNLEGVRSVEGGGVAWENITPVRVADGTTGPVGLTDGQETPQPVTLTVAPETHQILYPLTRESPLLGAKPRGDIIIQLVSNRVSQVSFSALYQECVVTSITPNTPDDGTPISYAYEFTPTRTNLVQ